MPAFFILVWHGGRWRHSRRKRSKVRRFCLSGGSFAMLRMTGFVLCHSECSEESSGRVVSDNMNIYTKIRLKSQIIA